MLPNMLYIWESVYDRVYIYHQVYHEANHHLETACCSNPFQYAIGRHQEGTGKCGILDPSHSCVASRQEGIKLE